MNRTDRLREVVDAAFKGRRLIDYQPKQSSPRRTEDRRKNESAQATKLVALMDSDVDLEQMWRAESILDWIIRSVAEQRAHELRKKEVRIRCRKY